MFLLLLRGYAIKRTKNKSKKQYFLISLQFQFPLQIFKSKLCSELMKVRTEKKNNTY